MKRLYFEDYEDFACDISDTFDNIEDEYGDISIIAKYGEAKEIIKELLCIGYNVASIELHRERFENYYDEYIIGLNHDGVWCEKFKRSTGYFSDESNVIYIMDNCSSTVISYCKSKNIYEVSIGDIDDCENNSKELETDHTYMVNGKSVDKETFDDYVSKFAPNSVDEDTEENEPTDSEYNITVKIDLDTDEAERIIRDMRKNFQREVSGMFDMLYRPYLYEYHPQPLRFYW